LPSLLLRNLAIPSAPAVAVRALSSLNDADKTTFAIPFQRANQLTFSREWRRRAPPKMSYRN
jgi:hypothetical protein